ncbi:MAG: (2Fe-2S)-binding protein [Anaerolineaceae bacterium]|nr:(2Fe-2S)-binding protein [Anaerolineaceae bacterium]
MRITKFTSELPAVQRGKAIEVQVNGRRAQAFEGELISTVLQAEGISVFGRKHQTGRPSGIYCGMGVCYECLVTVNGAGNIRACQTLVADKMKIETEAQVKP